MRIIAETNLQLPTPPRLLLSGVFHGERWQPTGLKRRPWRLVWEEDFRNSVVNGAVSDVLSVYLANGAPQKTAWYIGVIDNAGFSSLAPADAIDSHGGWLELIAYTETTRPAWTPGPVASGIVTNPTPAAFTLNATKTINGAFLVSNSLRGGTTGQLFATGSLSATQTFNSGEIFRVTYTITCSAV